jgi:hypothetical protein
MRLKNSRVQVHRAMPVAHLTACDQPGHKRSIAGIADPS